MVEKTRAMQMKERSFASKHFYLRNDIKGDLKGFQENFKTFFQVLPAVSGPDGENTDHSQNQSDCRICRILPTHELSKKWLFFGAFLIKQ